METVIIGFSRPKKFKPFAWIIMKVLRTNYDHVYVKFHSDSLERDIIYQASKTMINFMGTVVFENENIIVKEYTLEIMPENKKALMQFAVDNAGKPYSFKEIIGFAWVKINSIFGRTISNPFKEGKNEYVCSVLASYILENYLNRDIPGDFENVDPLKLDQYLASLNLKITTN
jgi:hypothetical protein